MGAGAAPQFDTYSAPSGPNVIPVGTDNPVITSSATPRRTRTTLPSPGVGNPAASDSSNRYSSPSGPQSIPTTVVNPGNDALATCSVPGPQSSAAYPTPPPQPGRRVLQGQAVHITLGNPAPPAAVQVQ